MASPGPEVSEPDESERSLALLLVRERSLRDRLSELEVERERVESRSRQQGLDAERRFQLREAEMDQNQDQLREQRARDEMALRQAQERLNAVVAPATAELMARLQNDVLAAQTQLGLTQAQLALLRRDRLDSIDQHYRDQESVVGQRTEALASLEGTRNQLQTELQTLLGEIHDLRRMLTPPSQGAPPGAESPAGQRSPS